MSASAKFWFPNEARGKSPDPARLLTPRRSACAAAAVLLLAGLPAFAADHMEAGKTRGTAALPVTLGQPGNHLRQGRPHAPRFAQANAEEDLRPAQIPKKRPAAAQDDGSGGSAAAQPVTLEQLRHYLRQNRPGVARSGQPDGDGSLPTTQIPRRRPGQTPDALTPEEQAEDVEDVPETAVAAKPVTLQQLATHLNEYRQGWAQFTQLNADGSTSRGLIIIKRPTRARIEYGLPNAGLIVAKNDRVAVFDLKSNSAPVIWALSRTPLYFLLQENIDIAAPGVLVDYRIGAASSEVAVRSPDKSFKGSVVLSFRHNPIRLAGWTYSDEFGQKTRVVFGAMGSDIAIDNEIFDIDAEVRRLRIQP